MRPKFTKIAVAVAALAVTALAMSGCSPAASDNGKFTVFAPQGADGKLSKNAFTKVVEDKFGLDFDFQTTTYDNGAAKEKRQISLASGDYPDAYMLISWVDTFSQAEILKYSKQGVIVPLDDLIKKYAPNMTKALDSDPERLKAMTAPDGHIYGINSWNDCYHCSYPNKLWLNSAWLKKLGLAQPTTTEELRTVLRAFKTQDPNGNGIADEIPLSGSISNSIIPYLMSAFTYSPIGGDNKPAPIVLKDGKVTMQATTDEWRAGLEYIQSLYAEGLIDSGAFTQNSDALKALGDNADAVIVGAATMTHPAILTTLGQADGRDKQYDAVPPLTGPKGVRTATFQSSIDSNAMFVLTNKSTEKERIAAIKMVDYLYTLDGQLAGQFGAEGVGWNPPKAGDVALDESLEPQFSRISGSNRSGEVAWDALAQYYSPQSFRNSEAVSTDIYDPNGYERRLFQATKEYDGTAPKDEIFPFNSLWPDPETSGELATLQTNITTYITQANAEFVTGQRNINDDAAWKSYVKDLNDLGMPRYLEIWQKMYDAGK
ncbi:ABC transporter substrate-binding protein [Plantibacter sp. Mn2098]|uniref:ABC transporter substrate-binding protein n=1 Tax=Plantibacter sp. Mn2098 TaxID=3395266 RepID=UPI003BBCB5DF